MTGSMDQTVRMYNFGAMSSTLQPYRTLEPDAGHVVTAVAWNARGRAVSRGGEWRGCEARGAWDEFRDP